MFKKRNSCRKDWSKIWMFRFVFQGVGTDEDELNRVIISRCEVDMIQIKEEYETLMKRSLEKHVHVCDVCFSDNLLFLMWSLFCRAIRVVHILMELLKDPSQRNQSAGNGKFDRCFMTNYLEKWRFSLQQNMKMSLYLVMNNRLFTKKIQL